MTIVVCPTVFTHLVGARDLGPPVLVELDVQPMLLVELHCLRNLARMHRHRLRPDRLREVADAEQLLLRGGCILARLGVRLRQVEDAHAGWSFLAFLLSVFGSSLSHSGISSPVG